ncbi:hypothetical protein LPJ56_005581 [Coemansia sp. RSA 2599]|nr:hypothetical protein LPJ75_005528 [Coemansia sp. RSA 2598]KAJ1812209.1 hypothetical protein LPJ56_005581 [Coemansia sp. RSA 2599]
MMSQTTHGLRFILWLSMFSTLFFIFLTFCISLQLHLSTLTNVRVGTYMRLEKFYVVASLLAAVVLPAIAVSQMKQVYWVPYMHSFNWPAPSWERRLVLWMCHYLWIILTIVYCTLVSVCLSLRIMAMWKDSVEVFVKPRMPEKWDWSKLTESGRPSNETISTFHEDVNLAPSSPEPSSNGTLVGRRISFEPVKVAGHGENMAGVAGRGYLVTLMSSDQQSGRPVAVRSYVDKKRFLRSIQRLALYPVIPILSLLGLVAMNMTEEPSKGLYIYGTVMSTTGGLLNLFIFMLNPALPDIWKEAALESL